MIHVRACVDIEFLSVRVFNSIARYRVEHEKRNFKSTSNHVLFCLSYKHNSP